jgi:hypothetical protein
MLTLALALKRALSSTNVTEYVQERIWTPGDGTAQAALAATHGSGQR